MSCKCYTILWYKKKFVSQNSHIIPPDPKPDFCGREFQRRPRLVMWSWKRFGTYSIASGTTMSMHSSKPSTTNGQQMLPKSCHSSKVRNRHTFWWDRYSVELSTCFVHRQNSRWNHRFSRRRIQFHLRRLSTEFVESNTGSSERHVRVTRMGYSKWFVSATDYSEKESYRNSWHCYSGRSAAKIDRFCVIFGKLRIRLYHGWRLKFITLRLHTLRIERILFFYLEKWHSIVDCP